MGIRNGCECEVLHCLLHLALVPGEELGSDIFPSPLPTGFLLRLCQSQARMPDVESGKDTPYSFRGSCVRM